jgi:GNAT superfamily N-acetyltransferase
VEPLVIRRVQPADLQALRSLYGLLEVVPEPSVSPDTLRERLRELESNPRHRIYVAEREGRIVGTFAMIFVPGLSHTARDSCLIEDVVVDSTLQGQGIGKQMMHFAMAQSAARDCYKMTLSSHVARDSAHRFYEALGFRRHGYSFLIDEADLRSASA